MHDFDHLLTVMLLAMLIWAGSYAIYTAIRLQREYTLFDNKFLYPANCKPGDCTDVVGFISYILPRLWILGLLCLAVAVIMALVNFTGALSFLPTWFVSYVLPFLGFCIFAWYIVVNARAAKKFW